MYNAVVLLSEDTLEEIKEEAKSDSFYCYLASHQTFNGILRMMNDANEMDNFVEGYKNYGVNSIYGKNVILV